MLMSDLTGVRFHAGALAWAALLWWGTKTLEDFVVAMAAWRANGWSARGQA